MQDKKFLILIIFNFNYEYKQVKIKLRLKKLNSLKCIFLSKAICTYVSL